MTVTPSCDTPVVTTQLRLLTGGDLPERAVRTRRTSSVRRPKAPSPRLDARTVQAGRSGVAEARRRLAAIREQDLVRAS